MRRIDYGVAMLVRGEDGKVLMQHRDNKPNIAFPDHWSVPTGGIKAATDVTWDVALENVLRELNDEIALKVSKADLQPLICETLEKPDRDLVRYVVEVKLKINLSDLTFGDADGHIREGQRWAMLSEQEIFSRKVPPTILLLLERAFGHPMFGFLRSNQQAAETFAVEVRTRFANTGLDHVVCDGATSLLARSLGWHVTHETTLGPNVLFLSERDPTPEQAARYGGLVTLFTGGLDEPRLLPNYRHLRFITPRSSR